MNHSRIRSATPARVRRIAVLSIVPALLGGTAAVHVVGANAAGKATPVEVRLSEWDIQLTPDTVPPGDVVFHVSNAGSVPHAFEVEGHGMERRTAEIKPGKTATLEVTLVSGASGKPASYDVYCPVGKGSHKMLGMSGRLTVEGGDAAAPAAAEMSPDMDDDDVSPAPGDRVMKATGGGPVIQILPGPYPFADSAMAVIRERPPDEQANLRKKAELGPYSDKVVPIRGDISVTAVDHGASGDSVTGTAHFTTEDGARWRLDLDRVQTKDVPFNPRFGGVIMGLYYHGATGVHTPLVPTIQSSLALWGYGHLYRDDQKVTDSAMVHIMLLSRTRRTGDWALDCWDCSDRPVEELQLQITPPPDEAPFAAPGGVLFVNWEKSTSAAASGLQGATGMKAEPGSTGDDTHGMRGSHRNR